MVFFQITAETTGGDGSRRGGGGAAGVDAGGISLGGVVHSQKHPQGVSEAGALDQT